MWTGGALVGLLLGNRMRATGDAPAFATFCSAFANVAGPLFGGSAILVLLTGIGMVAMDGDPAWGDTWIVIGFVGWLVSMVMGATVVGMSWMRIGKQLAEPGATIDATQPLISKAVTLTWIDIAIRVAVVLVMVWRPGS